MHQPSAELLQSVSELGNIVESLPTSSRVTWEHLFGLAAGIPNPRELAQIVLRKQGCSGPTLNSSLTHSLTQLKKRFDSDYPDMVGELKTRSSPLLHLWGERGPGMLRKIEGLIEGKLLADSSNVLLVFPFCGGGGGAHLRYNSVRIEAVLTHPNPSLPETVRLGWLLSQLQLDIAQFSERIAPKRLSIVAAAAMLPVALQAAADVDWTTCDQHSVSDAMLRWAIDADPEIVWNWWQTYLEQRTPWYVALAALDHELHNGRTDSLP